MSIQSGLEGLSSSEARVREASLGLKPRIIQIHPTLTCNLQCKHCYSSSAPSIKGALGVEVLCAALSDAAEMGYEVAAISGGEPLIYRELDVVLTHAKKCGMRTAVTTNGTLLDMKRLSKLEHCVDIMAISLDGPSDIHNEVRQSAQAFDRLLRGVDHVRTLGISFGFIHTLTKQSWKHLLWIADFASQQGASLLQLHPLELSGRAEKLMQESSPDDDILARAYLIALVLAEQYRGSMNIQLDVFRKDDLLAHPELVYASDLQAGVTKMKPADLLGLVVIEADGAVVPISYGFAKDYAICNLRHQRLSEAWPSYRQYGYLAFRKLCQDICKEIAVPSELPFFNWHELIVSRSHKRIVQ
jgi:Fe-coproporphyrin III synthase